MLLSERFPILYPVSIWKQRIACSIVWSLRGIRYATKTSESLLPERVFKHQSLLLRKLGNADMQLQHNKIQNLKVSQSD